MLLAVFGMVFFLAKQTVIQEITENQETLYTDSIKLYVESCLEDTFQEGIQHNFLQGGFYNPILVTDYKGTKVPYYFYLDVPNVPTISNIEKDLAQYTEDNIDLCFGDFKSFEIFKVEQQGNKKITSSIGKDKINIQMRLPLEITQGSSVKNIDLFSTELEIPLNDAITVLHGNMVLQQQEKNEVVLTDLITGAVTQDYLFDTFYQNDEVIYVMNFPKVIVNDVPLTAQYAIKYDWYGELDNNFDLQPIGKIKSKVGEHLLYQLNLSNGTASFNAKTDLFAIQDDGVVTFTPQVEQQGLYYIPISATKDNNEDKEYMILEIE